MAALASKSDHVPFRNRNLKDSLSGQVKSIMFMHAAPEMSTRGKPLSTAMFRARMSQITLRQVFDIDIHDRKAKDGGRAEILEGGSISLQITSVAAIPFVFCSSNNWVLTTKAIIPVPGPTPTPAPVGSTSAALGIRNQESVKLWASCAQGIEKRNANRTLFGLSSFTIAWQRPKSIVEKQTLKTRLERGAMPDFLKEPLPSFIPGVNARDADSYTLLHWAKRKGHLPVAEPLLEKGL
ncbi:hypothetical protein BSKO_09067 [Bryopsis sp. KO-2023]|nr:hypothetical protein BSKO_09067 [Bryopsis sp. KO-2023]